jgi:cell cycle arrest protein BUB3
MQASSEIALSSPPTDGISSLRFVNDSLLLVASWDSGVRLYDSYTDALKAKFHHKAAVLDCCSSPNLTLFSGGLDRAVKSYDLNSGQDITLGTHDKAVRCVEYHTDTALLVSGSWDKTLRGWDMRDRPGSAQFNLETADKVLTMSLAGNVLIVGTANRHVWLYDLRKMDEPFSKRSSSLKFQTRCIRIFPDQTGFATSSVEGRVAIDYIDSSPEYQQQKYAFKCHRSVVDGVPTVWPVNTIAFHPIYGTFATGGCDGFVNIWDGQNKKRLCQFHKYPTSIASLSFNSDGTFLAIASSYTFEEGEKEYVSIQSYTYSF